MKKIFILILSVTLAITLFGVSAFAASEPQNSSEEELPESAAENGVDDENIFLEIYRIFEENSDKVFSLLAFIGSLLIMLLYKRGLLPMLRGGILRLTDSVKTIAGESTRQSESCDALSSFVSRKIAECENLLEKTEQLLSSLELRLTKTELEAADRNSIFEALYAEGELLYELIMSLGISVAEKEKIREKISAICTSMPKLTVSGGAHEEI